MLHYYGRDAAPFRDKHKTKLNGKLLVQNLSHHGKRFQNNQLRISILGPLEQKAFLLSILEVNNCLGRPLMGIMLRQSQLLNLPDGLVFNCMASNN